jgi:DMSO/TMAO reductase YedYZ molybdopterin-dependent catalytic subunit
MDQDKHTESADSALKLQRRQWLAGSALAGLGALGASSVVRAQTQPAAAKPLPAYAGWKDPDSLIVHSSSTLETKRSAFGTSVITPTEQLYVRNNLPVPSADILKDRNAWQVSFEGVKQPRTMTLAELRTLGVETVATVLQCSGNGRGFFPSKPSGTPWGVGAAGCVIWSGVPLTHVVKALGGLAEGVLYITGTGGENLPAGVDPKSIVVERSVPLEALDDALLAWEMNGSPLSLAHGGPLRLIVPGYQGVNNIKYIKMLAFTAKESDARIMSHGYRVSPPGSKADPSQASVQEMSVKSWINSPLTEARAGVVQIHGVAFGGRHAVRKVEVSLDGGKQWLQARLMGPDLGKFAWRQFVLETSFVPGQYTLVSRATDMAGNLQPEQRVENVSGYNNTSWLDHAVSLKVV